MVFENTGIFVNRICYFVRIFLPNNGIADEKIIEKQKGLLVLLLAEVTEFILRDYEYGRICSCRCFLKKAYTLNSTFEQFADSSD